MNNEEPINSAHSFSEGSEYRSESNTKTAQHPACKVLENHLGDLLNDVPNGIQYGIVNAMIEYSDQQLAAFKEKLKKEITDGFDRMIIDEIIDLIDQL